MQKHVRSYRQTLWAMSIFLVATVFFDASLFPSGALISASAAKAQPSEKARPAKISALSADQKIAHLLNRITYGPRANDFERVKKMGWQTFLEQQLAPEKIADPIVDQKLAALESLRSTPEQIAAVYMSPGEAIKILRSRGVEVPDPAQMEAKPGAQPTSQPMAPTKPNPQNPSATPGAQDPKPMSAAAKPRDIQAEIQAILRENGYRPPQDVISELQQAKILRAVYSERQLQEVLTDFWFNHFNIYANKDVDRIYVTQFENEVIRPRVFGKFEDLLKATAHSPAMLYYLDNWLSVAPPPPPQKANRGINENYARELMELHTLGVDGGYTQKDVQEVARCFTGWTIDKPRQGGGFDFVEKNHDDGEKIVLGNKIQKGGGIDDGNRVIHILATHPSTAKFIATKLARRFVSDTPPQSLIDRASKVFLKTDGDLRQVVRTILTSPEFWSTESYRAKIKTPFELTVSAVRTLGAETDGSQRFHAWISQMGQPLYLYSPPTGYSDLADYWLSAGALLQRINFAFTLLNNRIPGTTVNLMALARDPIDPRPTQVSDRLIRLTLLNELSPQSRATLDEKLKDPQLTTNSDREAQANSAKIAALILGAPEFQRR